MTIRYRPEIDGLRTIAVISVIIYHAKFAFGDGYLLPGGFLGVDVFFVISGFLITSLMVKEFYQTDRISIIKFYERRARRLLPALFVVMLVSIPFAWHSLLSEQFIDYAKSLIASLIFSSNFYWNYELQEYGAESALFKPFLHTWSLAVEEQYYIIFPLILLSIFSWCRKYALILLMIGVLSSLFFAEWMSNQDSSFSFYMLPSRFWELLAGAVLANALYFYPMKRNTFLDKTVPTIGLALIIFSVIYIEPSARHPGFITVIPVLGTLLIILFASKDEPVTRILSSKIFVSIGIISYSLYLWHYPIFVFLRVEGMFENPGDKLFAIALTFFLSIISYYYVERVFRSASTVTTGMFISLVAVSIFVIGVFSYYCLEEEGFPARYPSIVSNIETNVLKSQVCKKKFHCSYNKESPRTIFLLGDSHMFPLEFPMLKYAYEKGYNFNVLNKVGCQYILNLDRVSKKSTKVECSSDFQEQRRRVLLSAEPSIVILGGRLPMMLSEDRFDNMEGGYEGVLDGFLQYPNSVQSSHEDRKKDIVKEYRETILELANYGHHVIIIYPIPEVGWNVPQQLKKLIQGVPLSKVKQALQSDPITTSFDVFIKRTKESFELLNGVVHENITNVYPHKLFCNTLIEGRCVTHDLDDSFYRDDDHMSKVGASMIMNEVQKKLEEL